MPGTTYFFVHVMKTGGTTFKQHIEANFPPEQRYPLPRHESGQGHYIEVASLLALTPEERAQIRIYSGHFPFAAAKLVGADVTLTILRHPVERTLSLLRQLKRTDTRVRGWPLERIYEDPMLHAMLVKDYQAKIFSLTEADGRLHHLEGLDVDRAKLEAAKANVESVDVLGINERYHDFLAEVRDRLGWRIVEDAPDQRVSHHDLDVPASFRARIAEDNPADMELYEHARRLVAERQRVA